MRRVHRPSPPGFYLYTDRHGWWLGAGKGCSLDWHGAAVYTADEAKRHIYNMGVAMPTWTVLVQPPLLMLLGAEDRAQIKP